MTYVQTSVVEVNATVDNLRLAIVSCSSADGGHDGEAGGEDGDDFHFVRCLWYLWSLWCLSLFLKRT